MRFIADLHIHSRYSMATSRALSIANLSQWAQKKGIGVLGTGDFTHPLWRQELADTLIRDDHTGLYKSREFPAATLFCLQAEISCIYRKDGKTRKVHNLVFLPDLDAAKAFSGRLANMGKLASDGRPIVALDSRDLLEMALDSSPEAVLIPAHIWTPWYSVFGARSGFDRLEDCFGDLSSHIFALETGLSSDPAMNRLLSALDKYALVSNSDAHSGTNLGREANVFSGSPSYAGIFDSLRASAGRISQPASCGFLGTFEFYPQEGKYHFDGHRTCGISLSPAESMAHDNICPVCGKRLTIGVLHRVLELADRAAPLASANEPASQTLVPLKEIVAEILQVGIASKKVQTRYDSIVSELGPELEVLCNMPLADIRSHWEPLGEAVARVRMGNVHVVPGFDGEYGKIRIFEPGELSA